jgi:hypothetical protein
VASKGKTREIKLMHTSRDAVLENVRRYRAIASLYRQTAGFRPVQRSSLLSQAREWEHLALTELESYFMADGSDYDRQPQAVVNADAQWETRWETMAAA